MFELEGAMGRERPQGGRPEQRARSEIESTQHQQYIQQRQKQQQEQRLRLKPCARDLPDKQQQTRHNPVAEGLPGEGFQSDQ